MRSLEIPTSKAKMRLLSAAERLVSKKGFDAVSVRDVTQLAKANVAAVNYHFGSREGMMALMIAMRMGPIQEEQLLNLDLLEKKRGSKALPLEELLDGWLRPLLGDASVTSGSESIEHRSIARILMLPPEMLPNPVSEAFSVLWKRYLKAFSKCLKDITPEEVVWRLHLLNGMAIQSLMGDAPIQAWAASLADPSGSDHILGRLLRLAAPMMREGGSQAEGSSSEKTPQGIFDF